jgi:glycosyltransferase involved in cell wall biosynthesis
MRVLHLVPGNLFGGVETFIACTARRRDLTRELEHHYALCFEGRLAEELESARVPLHRLGTMRTSRPWTVARGRMRLRELVSRHRFDIALTHSSWPHAMFASVLRRAGVPTIYYLHGPIHELSWIDRWARRTRPAAMIAVSADTLQSGRTLFPDVPADVLNYPIPWVDVPRGPEVRADVRRELGVGPNDVLLFQASRADRWKGHDRLVEALARLRDVPGWTCCLASGAQRPKEAEFLAEVRASVRRHGLDERVRFLGERRDVPRLLAGADVYCQANIAGEGFSLAFMEAFAAACPIVTTRLGGAPELVDDASGILVPPGDTDAFARALERLVRNPAERAALGENARRRILSLCDPSARLGDLSRILSRTAFGAPGMGRAQASAPVSDSLSSREPRPS